MTFSESKTKVLTISNKRDSKTNPDIMYNDTKIEEVSSYTYLGITFTSDLKWKKHIDQITTKLESV